jgi:hypothetical protein
MRWSGPGVQCKFCTCSSAKTWHTRAVGGTRGYAGSHAADSIRVILGLAYESAEAVHAAYARVAAAGPEVLRESEMGPRERARGYVPG